MVVLDDKQTTDLMALLVATRQELKRLQDENARLVTRVAELETSCDYAYEHIAGEDI